MSYSLIGQQCRQILYQWRAEQHQHPLGPSNHSLYDRVTQILRREPDDTPENIYLALANEIRGVSGAGGQKSVMPNDGPPKYESLSDNEYTILRALRDAKPRRVLMPDLEEATNITRKTCGNLAQKLTDRGLVEYDRNARSGATITPAGEKLLSTESRTQTTP